jgi:uracil-DNA glycosylase
VTARMGVTVRLEAEDDFDAFRRHARTLLERGVAPQDVQWAVGSAVQADWLVGADSAGAVGAADAEGEAQAPLRIGSETLAALGQAALHHEPQRFALIYRWLWRVRQQPALRADALDPDRLHIAELARAVRRDIHKMRAFVRFREVPEPGHATPLHVAWFEPEHHLVRANAAFFQRRFAGMRFAVLTPRCSVRWDGSELRFGPGASKADAPPADAGEALWLTYYASIFNPARLKLHAMENEMPRKYWKNLPEAALIAPLAAAATERMGRMVETEGTVAQRRIPAAARAAHAPGHAERAVLSAALAADAMPFTAPAPNASPEVRHALLVERRRLADACRACPIGALATQAVHGEGPLDPPLMLVGEQPGDQEDLRGRPFVGPAGQLLDRALAALGWPREHIYLSNAVRHFKYEPKMLPRGKRRIHKTPAQQEVAACLHWLEEEIALVRPRAVVALGGTAARALLEREVAVTKERGQWLASPHGVPVLVTLHPSALLRIPPEHQAAAYDGWLEDLRQAAPAAWPSTPNASRQ